MDKPFVSIVVCVNRNPAIFRRCFKSLTEQEYPNDSYEIILVDATENNQAKAMFFAPFLKIVTGQSPSRGDMLNTGISFTKGEIIAFIDVDCVADSKWLSGLVEGFLDPQTVGTGGNVIMAGKRCNDLQTEGGIDDRGFLKFDKNKLYYSTKPIRIAQFLGANCAFRKSVLEFEGGYIETPPDIGCEDVELCVRLMSKGYKLKFVEANIYHPPRTTKSRLTNGLRDGRALCFLLKRHKPDLINRSYFFLFRNIIWDKGSWLMLLGFISELHKKDKIA